MTRDPEGNEGPNWWLIAAFTFGGAGLLATAYAMSQYWQGLLVNGGTALLLFALLVFSEPRLVRHLRQPRNLNEAVARFMTAAAAAPTQILNDSVHIKERILRVIGSTGLHQDPPTLSSARFTNLRGAVEIEWYVEWDEKGIRHLVTMDGKVIHHTLNRRIGWDKQITVHEQLLYEILCHLLHELEHRTMVISPAKTS